MTLKPVPVLVLHESIPPDARADELDALVQVEEVMAALSHLGWKASTLATGLDLAATLATIRQRQPACVFNLVESLAGDGRMIHFVPALLETAGLRFTGASSDALYLSSHKLLAKNWMRLHGIATPDFFSRHGAENTPSGKPADSPTEHWIVKSVWEHASFGLDDGCVASGIAAAQARIEHCVQQYGGDWFAEQFIDGREFNIAVLERNGQPVILPLAEMTFVDYPEGKPKIVSYAAKWDDQAPEFHATQRVFPAWAEGLTAAGSLTHKVRAAIEQVVYQCWTAFGLNGYARVDIRLDAAGTPWVLEINANPCIAHDAGYTAAALQAGMSFEQLVAHIVQATFPAQ